MSTPQTGRFALSLPLAASARPSPSLPLFGRAYRHSLPTVRAPPPPHVGDEGSTPAPALELEVAHHVCPRPVVQSLGRQQLVEPRLQRGFPVLQPGAPQPARGGRAGGAAGEFVLVSWQLPPAPTMLWHGSIWITSGDRRSLSLLRLVRGLKPVLRCPASQPSDRPVCKSWCGETACVVLVALCRRVSESKQGRKQTARRQLHSEGLLRRAAL